MSIVSKQKEKKWFWIAQVAISQLQFVKKLLIFLQKWCGKEYEHLCDHHLQQNFCVLTISFPQRTVLPLKEKTLIKANEHTLGIVDFLYIES